MKMSNTFFTLAEKVVRISWYVRYYILHLSRMSPQISNSTYLSVVPFCFKRYLYIRTVHPSSSPISNYVIFINILDSAILSEQRGITWNWYFELCWGFFYCWALSRGLLCNPKHLQFLAFLTAWDWRVFSQHFFQRNHITFS